MSYLIMNNPFSLSRNSAVCLSLIAYFLLSHCQYLFSDQHYLNAFNSPIIPKNAQQNYAAQVKLPNLGDPSGAIISEQQEYQTGQAFLRVLNAQLPINQDPLLFEYLQQLTGSLVFNSPLQKKFFTLIVIDNLDFNAFAAPGNIMGVNLGLLIHANSEDELASVIAHEIGHLSQRHYLRNIERRKNQQIISWASLIGGLLMLAGGQPDAGIAAITAGQAASINNQLKFSRQDEQEADRVGIDILYHAGLNPMAAANMFGHMQKIYRYRDDLKQFSFLLTHPLTESRISDAHNQAKSYPLKQDRDSFNFHLLKTRTQVLHSQNPQLMIKHFQEGVSPFPKALRYGIALAYLKSDEISKAKPIINKLYQESPHRVVFIALKAELLLAENKPKEAVKLLQKHLTISPDSFALLYSLAAAQQKAGQMQAAAKTLSNITEQFTHVPIYIWYELAEVEGLAGNIRAVHEARSQYFIAIGAFKDALRHLQLALKLPAKSQQQQSKVKLAIKQIDELMKQQKKL